MFMILHLAYKFVMKIKGIQNKKVEKAFINNTSIEPLSSIICQ